MVRIIWLVIDKIGHVKVMYHIIIYIQLIHSSSGNVNYFIFISLYSIIRSGSEIDIIGIYLVVGIIYWWWRWL